MNHIRMVAFLGTMLIPALNAAIAEEPAVDCDKMWGAFEHQAGASGWSTPQRIRKWRSKELQCASPNSFFMRLGLLYAENGQYDEAEKVERSLPPSTKEARNLHLAIQEWSHTGQSSSAEVLEGYRSLAKDYPDWDIAHLALGENLLRAGDHQGVADEARKALALRPTATAYALLAMGAHGSGDFETAVKVGVRAFQLEEAYQGDFGLMMTVAQSYLRLGRARDAVAVLVMLDKHDPNAANKAGFRELYLAARRAEGSSE